MLDIAPITTLPDVAQPTAIVAKETTETNNTDLDDDYDFARSNLRDIIMTATSAIGKLEAVADESESARTYEVLAIMLKNASEANEKLLNLTKAHRDIKKVVGATQETTPNGVSVQNAVFVGSTSELLSIIRKEKNAN